MGACTHHFKRPWIRNTIIVLYTLTCTSLLTAFFVPYSGLKTFLKHFSNYWLGTFLYILLTIAIVDLGRILLKRMKWVNQEKLASRRIFVLTGTVCISIIAALSVWGILNARVIRTTSYDVTIEKEYKDTKNLKIVLVADLHLGYSIGNRQMEDMVDKINAQKPDIICIAGDIFDNEYEALYQPQKIAAALSKLESRYGVYACYGNHDIQEPILAGFTFASKKDKKESDPRMDQFLMDANIKLLRDESILIDDKFYLVSRPDYEKPGRGITTRKSSSELTDGLDHSLPILLMEHQPKELQELADAGVDLAMCGHTHDGQMFPGNLTIDLMWENAYGYLKKDTMHSIVTSGVGVFGPNMRVGTKSEIVTINVRFQAP